MILKELRFCPCFALAVVVAALTAAFHTPRRPDLGLDVTRPVQVEGWIARPPELTPDSVHFELQPLQVLQADREISYPHRIEVFIYSSLLDAPDRYFDPPLRYGETVRFRSFLQDPTHYAVPGVPDFRTQLWIRRILHRVRLKSPLQLERLGYPGRGPGTAPIFRYLEDFERFSQRALTTSQFRLIESVFLGRKRTLEEPDRERIRRLGIFHLFVVSGFHVSILVFVLHLATRRLGLAGRLLTVGGLWIYVALVGWSVPTLRAGIMTSVFYLLLSAGLTRNFLNGLGLSALLILGLHPDSLFSPGFQFSFLCLCAIGLLVQPADAPVRAVIEATRSFRTPVVAVRRTPRAELTRRVRFLLEEKLCFLPDPPIGALVGWGGKAVAFLLATALCGAFIQLFTLPVSLHHSNMLVQTQWISNILLIPLFSIFITMCLILFLTYWLPGSTFAATLIGGWADLLQGAMLRLEQWSRVSYFPHPGLGESLLYLTAVLLVFHLTRGRGRVLLLFPPLLLFGLLSRAPTRSDGLLEVTLLDVGQGEGIHLKYPAGSEALIDTGGLYMGGRAENFVGERLLSRYLWTMRSGGLDYVLLTHPHNDHIQGFRFVRNVFPVGVVYYFDFLEEYRGPPLRRLAAGAGFTVDSVHHRVLHPEKPPTGRDHHWKPNDASLVVELNYGEFRMLFTGDVEREGELVLAPRLGPVTVLKLGHHGGRTSTSTEVLQRTRPQAAVFSAGRNNLFGHPAAETLARLSRAEVEAFGTPEYGSLRIVTDGRRWKLKRYSLETRAFRPLLGWREAAVEAQGASPHFSPGLVARR